MSVGLVLTGPHAWCQVASVGGCWVIESERVRDYLVIRAGAVRICQNSWPGGFGRCEFIVCHRKEGRLYMIIKCAQLRVVVSISTRGTRFL